MGHLHFGQRTNKSCAFPKKNWRSRKKERNDGENRRAKLDASALAQKVAAQEVGRAVGGETTVMMMIMMRRSFLGLRPHPHPLGSSAAHQVLVVQVSSSPPPPPPQTRLSSSGGGKVVLHGGDDGGAGGGPPTTPPAKGIIRLQAACSSIYCCRFIILGFLSLSLSVTRLYS